MSRHKFRAWDKEEKEMIDNVVPFFNSDGALECLVFGYSFGGYDFVEVELDRYEHIFTDPEFDERFVLMEYTGLKDKKGVEIYEGDVLFHPLQGRRKVFYPYSETVASYGLRNIDNGFGSTLQDSHVIWEVIGNIYENPELLGREAE